jgi:2-(1,2-epoxy-1,2-dihydrophenyl)acetyl-CoA isomerase
MYKTLLVERDGYVGRLIMNRPEKKNAWDETMLDELPKAINELAQDENLRVVVFAGADGDFSIGGDMRPGTAFVTHEIYGDKGPEALRQAFRYHWMRVVRAVYNTEKPTIAMTRGWVAGEGMGLALACDLRIGSETSRFLSASTRYGTFNCLGEPWFLIHHIGLSRATQMYFSSDVVDSNEAYRLGLLNWLVADEKLETETNALANRLASFPPISLRLGKLMLHKMIEWDLDTTLEMLAAAIPNVEMSEDHHEAIAAFFEKREPKPFEGR